MGGGVDRESPANRQTFNTHPPKHCLGCCCAGSLPAALGALGRLRVLHASDNRLAGSLAPFAAAAAAQAGGRLQMLLLNGNALTGGGD